MSENMPSHSFVARYPNNVQDASSTCICGEIRDSSVHPDRFDDERVKEIIRRREEARQVTAEKGWMAAEVPTWSKVDYLLSLLPIQPAQDSFQSRVRPWLLECFGEAIANDYQERNHRFLEESLELVQACGATRSEAHQLVDYVYGRPAGTKEQETGGVMVTLAALCLAQGFDMHEAGEVELRRIWTKVDEIRAKQAAKPRNSPLPVQPAASTPTSLLRDPARIDVTELSKACQTCSGPFGACDCLPPLVVTRNGVPRTDQKAALEEFKQATAASREAQDERE